MKFEDRLLKRRSMYELDNKISISDEELEEMIYKLVKNIPSSYNAQSQRAVLLLGEQHNKLWIMVMEELRKLVPEDKFPRTEKKINRFKAAYGTILYFDDLKVRNELIERFPLYKENTTRWADVQNGMLQYAVWTSLADKGIGASLQHYSEVIDKRVKAEFAIPEHWELLAQMPFGNIIGEPKQKTFVDMAERFKVIK